MCEHTLEVLARVEAQKRAEMTMREKAFEAVEGDKAMGTMASAMIPQEP